MKKVILTISLIFIFNFIIFTGCTNKKDIGEKNEVSESVTEDIKVINIDAQEAKKEMEKNEVIILDVRSEEEYNSGHIENSILIPIDKLEEEAENILNDKNKKILVYCRSGNRSKKASNILLEKGYTNVYDFGGIKDWPYEIVK
ncbi:MULTISPECIES: rhodanese-like domain-containing protein [Clostridium]|uniref:rhodanese-like domain-containing protein n=1 Tax=Clostridium TaxID=1485 RepID=UPI001A9ADADF|nr:MULTISPECIES: rhodanese-like domain-containing protein [Clostridium]MBS5305044.1 rhodanese-like domain-containing protein [Clostridium sp.]MDB1932318.1 rhodanese-like domain-containing protein [Clostridium tertium]MDB1936470.1 rhodanese-like domain-containing protein [Clostridium tertium]MDB1942950.1 rhodanese-like domain-containing protein [Clostridium tertium]MDB1950051.1 rhodanese-like domain-containing protein [Clostridium tertium]